LGGGAVFRGYYTEPLLSYQSINRWGTSNSPSNASGWIGCSVGADNHTVVSKRTGVPSNGVYSVTVNQHDDNMQFYVGGTNQFEVPYCCFVHTDMYTGYMDNTTTLEMRHGEGGGGSNQGLTFTQQNLSATVTKTDLTQSSACGTNTGRIIFSNPTGAVASPVFRSNFSAGTGVTLSGSASVTSGYLQLTANSGSLLGGAILANSTNMNGSVFRSEFDYRIFDGSAADGISFNYADMSGAPANTGENGFGNGLSVCFVTYSGAGGPLVRIKYAGVAVGADVAVTLRDANFRKCIITVDASNQISVSIAGTAVITNRALPAAFQSANKTNWQYSFAARTGGATDSHRIDNLVINTYNQYEYSINGTTWNNTGVFTGVAAGTYTPRIRNAAFTAYPVSLANVTLSEPPAPSITSVVTDRTCPSSNNGAINVTLTGGLSNVQYIRIIQNKADYMNLAEVQAIEVFSGTNVALSKVVTTTSNYDAVNYPPSELVNGIVNVGGDMWHGNFGTIGQYAEINLAAGYNLDYIRIFNRADCCWDRADNLVLELRNTAGVLVYSKVINAYNGNNNGSVPYDNNVLNLSWADGGTPLSRTNLAAGNYTLNYLDDAGCTIAHAKTVGTTNTVPSITSVTAAANPICPSATTTITANGVGGSGASLTWYTGTGGTGTNLGATNPLTVGSGTYYARVTGTCTPAVEANITINTHVLDYVNLQFPNAPAAICQGSSVTVYGQVYEPGVTPGAGAQGAGIVAEFGYSTTNTNPNTWTNWFAASFNAAGGGANNDEYQYVFTPPAAGTYYYAYRYRLNACANQYGGYSGTGGGTWNGTTNVSGSITVNAPSVAPTGITGTTTICNGGSSTLTLSGGSAGAGATAQWFTGSCGGTAAGTGNSITVSPSTTTTYYVRYSGTCNTTTCASTTVTVNALSTTPASITGTTSICTGGSTTLTSTGGTLGGDALDIWYSGSCGTEVFTQEWTTIPYTTAQTTVNSIAGGVLNVSSTGNDPMIYMDALGSYNPSVYRYIQLRYRVTAGTAGMAEIFFYNANHAFAVGGESATGSLISDGSWHIMNIDMTADPNYTTGGNITGWRFDWSSAAGVTMDIDFISLVDNSMLDAAPSITVSPTTTTTYYVNRRGACNTTTCASTTVNVGGSTNVILAPSNQLGIASSCDDGLWTYYESTTTPGKYVFAINWNPNGGVLDNSAQKAAAVVSINKASAPTGTAPTASPVTFVSGGASPGYYMCADPSTSQATFAMQRYWNVNVGGGTLPESVNVRFFFDPLEYDAVVNAANAWSLANGGYVEGPHWFKSVAATDGINNTWNPGSDMSPIRVEHSGWVTDLNPLVSGYGFENSVRYVQFDGITSFSGGGLATGVGNGTSLPLDLISFMGTKEGTYNHLSWITAHERNVSHFDVQRSSDAVHFITIGTVAALGNTTEEEDYDFNDNSPLAGNNYYRLRMIDLDGTSTTSNIINLNRPVGYVSLTNLYPNPAKTIVNFELYSPSQEDVNVKVLDVLGREVFSSSVNLQQGLNTNTLDVSQFTPGLYFLNVTCCGGKVITYKFTCDSN
jgi:hypothetical protein